MKITGKVSDRMLLKKLRVKRKKKSTKRNKSFLEKLTGKDFGKFLKDYPDYI